MHTAGRAANEQRWLRFSLRGMFAATLAAAGLLAWFRPGPEPPRLQILQFLPRKAYQETFRYYDILHPDGTSENLIDFEPFGSLDEVRLLRAEGSVEVGAYGIEGVFRRGPLRFRGILEPGDESLCQAHFDRLLVELFRRKVEVNPGVNILFRGDMPDVLLDADRVRLEDVIRAARRGD